MRYLLLTPFCAFFASLFFTGYSGGAAVNGLPRSGAPLSSGGNEQTCTTCHSGGSFSPIATLQVFEPGTTTEATSLRNTRTYDVKLTVAGTNVPTNGGYGFQLVALKNSDKSDAGTFSAAGVGVQFSTIGTRVYAEHTTKNTSGVFTFKWKPNSTSPVTFYYVGNAVNGNGGSDGDMPTNALNKAFVMATVNEAEVPQNNFVISVYPNPTTSVLKIKTLHQEEYELEIFDLLGRSVQKETVSGGINTEVKLNNLTNGIYIARLHNGKQQQIKRFTVQN